MKADSVVEHLYGLLASLTGKTKIELHSVKILVIFVKSIIRLLKTDSRWLIPPIMPQITAMTAT